MPSDSAPINILIEKWAKEIESIMPIESPELLRSFLGCAMAEYYMVMLEKK